MTTVRRTMKCYLMLCCFVTVFIIILKQSKYTYYYEPMANTQNFIFSESVYDFDNSEFNLSLKYVLVWTNPNIDPIIYLGDGTDTVEERNCSFNNCYVSSSRQYFENVKEFDVIVFHGPNINGNDLPGARSPNQKYVFASMESSDYYPLCDNIFNNYFNWTWTYKLHSDAQYGYISIRNKDDVIIGPKEVMQWMNVEEMKPIDKVLKNKLSTKKYAAAWFVSNCNTPSKREAIADALTEELYKYNLTIHVYGRCGSKACQRSKMKTCLQTLQMDYYFYLSFENSLDMDYVTEKLLHALQHYTVPIVYGGANYTRFMPDGIYLDARKLSITELAKRMAELIEDKAKYYDYFRWHNHYSYHSVHQSPESDSYCRLCALINDEKRFQKTSVYPDFVDWWNVNGKCKM